MALYKKITSTDTRTDHLVDHTTKQQAPYIVANAERIINALVSDYDPKLQTALRYFHGERDSREFAAITSNYGVGNPNKLPFISLMQRHIKTLVGVFMQLPFPATVSATDRDSISEAKEELAASAVAQLSQLLNSAAAQAWQAGPAGPGPGASAAPASPINAQALQDVKRKTQTFTSSLEQYCSVLLDSLIDRLQLRQVISEFVEQMTVAGRMAFRVWLEEETQLPRWEIIPLGELHTVRTTKGGSIRSRKQVVRKRKMLRSEVLARWGRYMSEEEKQLVGGQHTSDLGDLKWVALRAGGEIGAPVGRDAQGNPQGVATDGNYLDVIAMRSYGLQTDQQDSLIDVCEVEFASPSVDKEADEADNTPFRMQGTGSALVVGKGSKPKGPDLRQYVYRTVRIGSCMYLATGEYKYAQRPVQDPNDVYLTYNGTFDQRSIILDAKDLQDKYDLLSYHQDNLVALGGVPGVMMDINDIPKFFGKDTATRVSGFLARLKQGIALVDRTQQGRNRTLAADAGGGAFANSGSIDTSFNGQSVAAIRELMSYIEEQASRVSGVPRQMQGEIQERDGKAVTQEAINGGSVVNRQLFGMIFQLVQQGMTDMINLARVTAAHNPALIDNIIGTRGTHLIAAGAARFPLADLNVHIKDAIEEQETLSRLKSAGDQLVAAMAVDPRLLIDVASINNVAKLRETLLSGVEQFKDDQAAALQQENDQLKKQLQQLQGTDQQLVQAQLQLDQQKVQGELAQGEKQLQLEAGQQQQQAAVDAQQLELEQQRVELEAEQLLFSKQSAEVSNS